MMRRCGASGLGRLSSSVQASVIRELAERDATPLSLQAMYQIGEAGDALAASQFLHGELPVRMAQRIEELRSLLGEDVSDIVDYYEKATLAIVDCARPSCDATEASFAGTVKELLSDRHGVPVALAAAVRRRHPFELDRVVPMRRLALDEELARFFTARIGLRFLVEHYVSLREPGQAGLISNDCVPGAIALEAARAVEAETEAAYGAAPTIDVVGDMAATLTYVPTHMREAIGELLRNSARAVAERHGAMSGNNLPAVRVVVAAGATDVGIKVEDEGGGLPRSARHNAWSWFWSSKPAADIGREDTDPGLGMGLPMTRCLARYFGGELMIRPLEGHGTDAYLHLTPLGDAQCENLPRAARLSPGDGDSSVCEDTFAFFDERPRS